MADEEDQHPLDPSIVMIVVLNRAFSDGEVIPARMSKVGVDLDGSGLAAYRKGDDAYTVGWWITMNKFTVDRMPVDLFEAMEKIATR